jgi:tricorn protease
MSYLNSVSRAFALVGLIAASAWAAAEPIKRAQYPTVSPDGKVLVFSWQGDLWRVPIEGGPAQRLTVHPALDILPKFSPDGKRVVFSSNRYGSSDLFSIAPDGTGLQRLTFESATELPWSFSPDGQWVYGHTNAFGRADCFKVPVSGGDLVRLTGHPFETEYSPSVTHDGKSVIYQASAPLTWRKPAAKGSYTGEIWIADNTAPLTNHRQLTKNDRNDNFPCALPDGSILFVSNRSGWPNLWRMNANGGSPRQLTRHTDGTVRYPSVSGDGRTVAYEFASGIWRLDLATGAYEEIAIETPADQRVNPNVSLTLTSGVAGYAVSSDGKRMALSLRGDIFLIPEKGGTTRRLTSHPALDVQPQWLDNQTILFTTGRNGKRELYVTDLAGNQKAFLSDAKDVCNPSISPDRKWVAFHRGMDEVCLIPAGGGAVRALAQGYFEDALRGDTSLSWAPDSKHLAVNLPTDRGSNVHVIDIETGKNILVARSARGLASAPKFLPNGRALYFTAYEYEDADLFVVDLMPEEPTFSEDDLDKLDAPKDAKKTEPKVEIFEPGLDLRMRRLTQSGASSPEATPDGRSIWVSVQGQVVSIPVTGGTATPIGGITGAVTSVQAGVGKMYFVQQGRLLAYALDRGVATPVSFSAQLDVNLKQEEMALFDEIWWALDRMYYDEKYHGTNWAAVKAKYAKIVPQAFDRSDFYALMGEMMEELNSSHLGFSPPAETPSVNEVTAWLGIEWDPQRLAEGAYVVGKVYPETPAFNPASQLRPGDRVDAVDGVKLGPGSPFAAAMNGKAGKKVALTVMRGNASTTVLIKPVSTSARSSAIYEDWVAWEREQVEKLSGGRLTYLHIEGMNQPSHERFLREIRTLTQGKHGVILDVRFNGGGSTSHLALGVLIKRPWLIRTFRGSQIRLSENINRGDSLELPSALMCNQQSFSNAEMFAEGFRSLKIGPVIGMETAGGVISTGTYSLWDGGTVRMPIRGAFTLNGENLEGNGRKPDVVVPFDPNAWQAGRDVQLERAVETLLKRLP